LQLAPTSTSLWSGAPINRIRETVRCRFVVCLARPLDSFFQLDGGSFQTFKDGIGKVLVLTIVIMNVVSTHAEASGLAVDTGAFNSPSSHGWPTRARTRWGELQETTIRRLEIRTTSQFSFVSNLPLVFLFILESRSYLQSGTVPRRDEHHAVHGFFDVFSNRILAMVVAVWIVSAAFWTQTKSSLSE
jgi:hypothetical protein